MHVRECVNCGCEMVLEPVRTAGSASNMCDTSASLEKVPCNDCHFSTKGKRGVLIKSKERCTEKRLPSQLHRFMPASKTPTPMTLILKARHNLQQQTHFSFLANYSIALTAAGAAASRSIRWTFWRSSLDVRNKLEKYFLASEASARSLSFSSRLSWSFSTLRWSPICTSFAGFLSALRTSELMRRALECVYSMAASWAESFALRRWGRDLGTDAKMYETPMATGGEVSYWNGTGCW